MLGMFHTITMNKRLPLVQLTQPKGKVFFSMANASKACAMLVCQQGLSEWTPEGQLCCD
jgi:hypothetical protein